MSAATYNSLALDWQPSRSQDSRFITIAVIALIIAIIIGLVIESIEVPKETKRVRVEVPERVAKFIKKKKLEKPKPQPKKVEKKKPKPPPKKEPKPKEEKPPVKVERPVEKVEKPKLTEKQEQAREVAAKSGILALQSEFADMIDTSDVSNLVGTKAAAGNGANEAAGYNVNVLTANATQGSGGVDASKFATKAGTTQLAAAVVQQSVDESLAASEETFKKKDPVASESREARGDKVRSEEEVTVIFDRQKGRLQQTYNRARRKNPALKGKIVFEITISPDGTVSNVRVVSSELNDAQLERKLVARIKQFQFGAKSVEPVTVTYPIEFLPS